jgi:hypothetical protein
MLAGAASADASLPMPDPDLHAPPLGQPGEPCSTCGAPLAADQRYCLECGGRRAPARLDPVAMARGAEPAPERSAPPLTRAARSWTMPSPRVVGAAALLMLGFGVAAAAAVGPRASSTLASAPRRIIVVAQPAPAAPAPEPKPARTQSHKPAPVASPEPMPETTTPAPAPTPPASSTAAPSKPAAKPKPETEKPREPSTPTRTGPDVKHVWLFALTGHTMDEALASPSPMPYLSGTLRPMGVLLSRYRAVTAGPLANLISLISGRQPTWDQQAGCPAYKDVDLEANTGCVFAKDVETLPGQLTAAGRTWRAYVEDSDAGTPPDTCRRPASGAPLDPVAARNPLLFFHAIADTPDCGANVAGSSRLAPDAADAQSAPSMSLVIPNACHNGADQPCAPDAPAGLLAADAWLAQQVGPILSSPAYADGGVVIVTFDVAPDLNQPVGAFVLSKFVKAGATEDTPYSHVDLLRTLEDLFELEPLGAAAASHPHGFAADVWSITKPSQ